MDESITKKNGLVYSDDENCVVGIDSASSEFTGTVPYGPKRIEEEAFSCCSLKNIALPESIESVGANLFCNSTELETVCLPGNLKELSPFMFCGCKSLVKVDMPVEVEDFTEGLFAECSSLKEIPFCNGVKTLPEGVFDGCSAVTTMVIPDSVTKICTGAIVNCESLTTIVLPKGLVELEDNWLKDCPNLRHIRISDENQNFKTDEECQVLYKKNSGGIETVLIRIENKDQNEVPTLKDDLEETPSIISYDEAEDDNNEDVEIILNENEKIGAPVENEIEEPVNNASQVSEEVAMTDAGSDEKSMEDKLAEILGQNKMYDEGNFSIMDIPEASEEEIENSKLESKGEEEYTHTPVVQIEVPVEREGSMEDRLKEIMGQEENAEGFSIFDIPVASDAELEANKLMTGEDAELVEADPETTEEDAGEVPAPVASSAESSSDKIFMQNLMFETAKAAQQNTGIQRDTQRILFVFAENVVETDLGSKFSKRLERCCQKLAKIHGFTAIYFLHNVRLDTDKFISQFEEFMRDKDVVIACEGGNLLDISDRTKILAGKVGISLTKESIENEISQASDPSVSCLKLLIQDNLAD
ncbi:MAG: leucine-rich repeat protein [Treponema sp.]|nr:leucine-rich repeat protein [Treponema sp.]